MKRLTDDEQINLIVCFRKSIVCGIAGIEALSLTPIQADLIVDGIAPSGMYLTQIDVVRMVNKGIDELLLSLNTKLSFEWMKNMNQIIWHSPNSEAKPAELRIHEVHISNSKYIPPIPIIEHIDKFFLELAKINNVYERAATALIQLSKMQLFNDCNKRTAMFVANKILLNERAGALEISIENRPAYIEKLSLYYETESTKGSFVKWLVKNCIYNTPTMVLEIE